jgi:predicted outer membrane repeat protein
MRIRRSLFSSAVTGAAVLVACGGASPSDIVGDGGAGPVDGSFGDGTNDGARSSDGAIGGDGRGTDTGNGAPDVLVLLEAGPPNVVPPTCTMPIAAADTTNPTTVVGTGVPSSCTVAALTAAVAKGGTITFNCGGVVTFTLTQPLQLPIATDTVIDGGGKITLDGNGATRVLSFNSPNFRATTTTVTLQHLGIVHGASAGTAIATAPPPCSQGTNIDGGGAGIFVRDGKLHVIDVTFSNNQAALAGPDVGGGAIYAEGSLDVTVVNSYFISNSGSNGGAIGSLNSDVTLVGDMFTGGQATGTGANSVDTTKCAVAGGQIGSGGNGGAVAIDGGSDGTATICGCVFFQNSAKAFGGALFRTADNAMQKVSIDQTRFEKNTGASGGGAMYIHNCSLDVTASLLTVNTASGGRSSTDGGFSGASGGAVQADSTNVNFVNDTFQGNIAMTGLGGALALFSNGGTIQNVTFADNAANGGPGYFGAAIAGGATLAINDTVFSNNFSTDCNSPMGCQVASASTGQADIQWPQQYQNCVKNDTPCIPGATTFADPLLLTLTGNGGPTSTMLPQAGSPAIGAGSNCPSTDQRGFARKATGCTLGAVEAP